MARTLAHARIQKKNSEGVRPLTTFFMGGGGTEDPTNTKRGPSSVHLNGVSLANRCRHNIECWLVIFVIFRRIRTSISKKPYIFVIFQGGGGVRTPSTPLDPPIES